MEPRMVEVLGPDEPEGHWSEEVACCMGAGRRAVSMQLASS